MVQVRSWLSTHRYIVYVVAMIVFFCCIQMNLSLMATDSGFDVDYDSGTSGSSDGGVFDIIYLIYMLLRYPIIAIPLGIILLVAFLSETKKPINPESNIHYIMGLTVDDETKKILFQGYQVFYNVQIAWMNFDDKTLQSLLTDEMYQMYRNQMDTLSLKGQQNKMDNFQIVSIQLLSRVTKETTTTTIIALTIRFHDYIVDSNGQVVRGSKSKMVRASYHLTFVENKDAKEVCPNCGATLTSPTYCEYCKSHIQGLSLHMRLAKKEVVTQQIGG